MLGENLPLSHVPGFEWTANQPFVMGPLGDVHADTIFLSWGCMAFILLGAAMVRPMLTATGPGGAAQGFLEMIYDFTADITRGQIGHHWRKFFPLIAGIFIFVLTANFAGILPWQAIGEAIPGWPAKVEEHVGKAPEGAATTPAAAEAATTPEKKEPAEIAAPSTDFNVTFGLATIALLTYLGSGFWAHGGKYLKLYLNPIEWLDLVIRPATLSLRLMMVITADELMRGAALMMVPVLLPTGVMGFEMFIAVIQAFVFALLTAIYIGLTVSHH